MTRAFIRFIIVRAVILFVISLIILVTSHLIVLYRDNIQLQIRLRQEMAEYVQADYFEVVDESEYAQFSDIRSVIVAYDNLDKPINYIIDVQVLDESSVLDMRIFLSEDAETINNIIVLNVEINDIPSEQILAELSAQFEGARIPVALSSVFDEDYLAQNEYQPIQGLHDGVFYAEMDAFNSAGYKDFVEITVRNGRIIDVVWDALAQDQGKNRAQASVDGEFPMPEGQAIWAAQAYAVQNKLIEVQNPINLAVRSDGRTEVIENVEINLQIFLTLLNNCIEDSLQNNTRVEHDHEEDAIEDEEALEVEEYIPIPSIEEDVQEQRSSAPIYGFEDGVVDSGNEDSYIFENVDGLPISEIRTTIDGVEDHLFLSSQMVSGVNEAYKFVRAYLRWGG